MTMTMMSDMLFRDVPNPARLREVIARAFGVAAPLVNLRTVGDLAPVDPESRVQLIREPEPLPGDFAAWYNLNVAPDLVSRVDDVMDTIAHDLGIVTVTDAEDYFEMTLHLPDGTRHTVELYQDEENVLRITPEIQRLIDGATRQQAAVAQTAKPGRRARVAR